MLFIPDAFLIHDQKIYVPDVPKDHLRAHTPITVLIEGICAQFPDQARIILRERICTKTPLTPRCDGMIKVAAKRASILDEDNFSDRFLEAETESTIIHVTPAETPKFEIADAPKSFETLELAYTFTLKLKGYSKAQPELSRSDRMVGALLLGPQNETLAYAWNTNGSNRTQHAELNLLRTYLKNGGIKIPANSTLVVSLKPCAMCAAQILAFAESISTLKIIYLENDPGPKAQNSVLQKDSEQWKKYGEPKVQFTQLDLT